jgi:hypothetical protein
MCSVSFHEMARGDLIYRNAGTLRRSAARRYARRVVGLAAMRTIYVCAGLALALAGCDKRAKNDKALKTMASGLSGLIHSGIPCEKVVEGEGGEARGSDDVYGTPTRLDCKKNELCSAGPDRKHHTSDDQCVPIAP